MYIIKSALAVTAAAIATCAACAAPVESKPIEIILDLSQPLQPKTARELREERTAAMLQALKVKESEREVKRYNRRRWMLNEIGYLAARASLDGVPVDRVNVDLKTGDIWVYYSDGHRFVHRIDKEFKHKGERIIPRRNSVKTRPVARKIVKKQIKNIQNTEAKTP